MEAASDNWLLWVIVSTLVCAFSSGMEMAFLSANHLKVELDKKQGLWSANIVSYFINRPQLFLSAMLVGNNIGLVVFGMKLGDEIVSGIENHLHEVALFLGEGGLLLVQTILSTIIILVFGEFLPKIMVTHSPNRWLNILAVPMLLWCIILWPFAMLVMMLAHLILGKKANAENEKRVFGRVDLDDYLEKVTGQQDPTTTMDHEIEIFQNALDFSKVKARDCMIPRNEIIAVPLTISVADLKSKFVESQLSKILVFKNNIDNIIGYVHSFDLLSQPTRIQNLIRPVAIIPEAMPAQEMLSMNIREKKQVFIVVDEFGGTAGMATLEDIIEEIVGEIEDEHDIVELVTNPQADGSYIFTGRDEIKYINDQYGLKLEEDEEKYDTINGMILHCLENFPVKGQEMVIGEYLFKVMEIKGQLVGKVRVTENK